LHFLYFFDLRLLITSSKRCVSTTRIPSSTITGRNTRQTSPHLVWLLRQARGCCWPIRSTPDPHRDAWWLKHTSLALTSHRREVEWTRFDQSAGHVNPFNWSSKHCLYVLIILTWWIPTHHGVPTWAILEFRGSPSESIRNSKDGILEQ
jgi:hypothetical protein